MLNEINTSLQSYFGASTQTQKKKYLMRWYKSIPELTALANKVARDIVSKYHFENVDPSSSGRNRILRANEFALQVNLKRLMLAQVIDMLITGEAFGWIGRLQEKQVKEALANIVRRHNIETKEKNRLMNDILYEIKIDSSLVRKYNFDEDLRKPRKYLYVPSSTMEVLHDRYDVIGYRQIVGVEQPIDFTTDEIIHFTLQYVDGRVNGFTPVESIIVQLELLRQMWQNLLSIHKNGGSPDNIITLKDVRPGSEAYKRIEEQLMKYKLVENRHGNLLFTGNVDVKELNSIDKMQFMDSGLYITGLLAMQWQVPRSSIPYIVGGTNTKDDTGGNSERGYWDNIEFAQEIFADTMNSQLFIPYFGVKIVFDKKFVLRDIQEQTMIQLRLNNIKLENDLLGIADKQLSEETLLRDLNRTTEDVKDRKKEEPVKTTLDKQLSKDEVENSDDKNNIAKRKRDEQVATMNSAGVPDGVGSKKELAIKELDFDAFLEHKQLDTFPDQKVDLQTFIKLYAEDKAYHPGMPPRVFMRQNELFTTLRFKSSDFVYFTIIPNEELENNKVLLSNLKNIYRL